MGGPDTGKIELQKIINFLKENNYVFEDLEEATTVGSIVANFEKNIKFSDEYGNYINDRYIRIKIEFDSDFDYKNKNKYKDSEGDFLFDNEKGTEFIQKLIYNSYGGSRKKIIKRKKNTRRIRKN